MYKRQEEGDITDGDRQFDSIATLPRRPIRTVPKGKAVQLTPDDSRWLKYAKLHEVPIKFDLKNPKRAASFDWYENYKLATTIKQMYELSPDFPA